MILVNPTYERLDTPNDILGAFEKAEIGARTCYKSECSIKKDENGRSLTAEDFVEKLMNVNKHGSIAEHGTIYLTIFDEPDNKDTANVILKYLHNPYSKVKTNRRYHYITTNLRVINENDWWNDLEYYSVGKTPYHEERITVRFNTQIAITREANRHRVHSPSEQSTRYCNYSKDKFGGEINISVPEFVKGAPELEYNKHAFYNYCHTLAQYDYRNDYDNLCNYADDEFSMIDYWLFGNLAAEFAYLGMLRKGAKPEQARTVLPLDTNSELVHTAFVSDWIKFIKLRIAPNAHPDIQILANQMKKDFIDNGWAQEEDF